MFNYFSLPNREKYRGIYKYIHFYSSTIKILIIIATITYNTWIFTPYLNTKLDPGLAFVSEYASPSQDNSMFFRICDVVTGLIILFILLLFLKIKAVSKYVQYSRKIDDDILKNKFLKFINAVFILSIVTFAVCTIIDVILPMQCPISATPKEILQSPRCETLGNLAHEVTSALVGVAAVTMIVILMVWGESLINFNNPSSKILDLKYKAPIFIFGVLHCVSIAYTLFGVAFPENAWLGYGQRISIFSLSMWAIFTVFSFLYYKIDIRRS
ncbi:hypothetical protein HCQ94_05270 [Actinomyces sp. zg-332]|uniref:hypothetical protein n=1 Tax=Actinomyces sp. zg-332 TaxID=2708340 RepID=UPI001421406E|nr:hypothetical protein [Actinomyces sp. zg-332]QPK93981.1 hypothetical protein HCQ94_05270 [Actinomyces sp. zg-332]